MSLAEYAKKDSVKTGYTAWKDLNNDNQKAWEEALAGYKSGIPASVVYRWLQEEKNCPLTDSTVRNQLISDSKL
tara:strand:+ start:2643 stop:2864 length:222 start_codon:yes stop_codon:yes gene_type:complete